MTYGRYFRHIGAHNADEYEQVVETAEIWGLPARTLASGLCVQAVPIERANTDNGYSFRTPVPPKESLGFPLNGPPIVREVFWFEGSPGVESRENGTYVAIPVQSVRKGKH